MNELVFHFLTFAFFDLLDHFNLSFNSFILLIFLFLFYCQSISLTGFLVRTNINIQATIQQQQQQRHSSHRLQLRFLQEMQRLQVVIALHLLQPRQRSIARKHFIQRRIAIQLEQLRQRRLGGADQLHLVLVELVHQRDEPPQLRQRVHREHRDVLQHHRVELVACLSHAPLPYTD